MLTNSQGHLLVKDKSYNVLHVIDTEWSTYLDFIHLYGLFRIFPPFTS